MSNFIINPNKRSGYPIIDDNTFDFGEVQTSPYPKLVMYLDGGTLLDGYPRMYNWNDFSPVQDNDYPCNMFSCVLTKMSGYPSFSSFGDFSPVMSEPHPREMMSCKEEYINGYPTYRVANNFKNFGAFQYSPIAKVTIPPTVKYISDYTFWNTKIKKVTIHPDCIYYEHSFPEDCQIEFYEE